MPARNPTEPIRFEEVNGNLHFEIDAVVMARLGFISITSGTPMGELIKIAVEAFIEGPAHEVAIGRAQTLFFPETPENS